MLVNVKPVGSIIQTRSTDLRNYLTAFLVTLTFGLCLSLYSGSSQAEIVTDISSRVTVDFEPVKHKWRKQRYHATVVVTNISSAEVHSPIRLIFTEFKNKRHLLKNADGVNEDGFPYVEIILPSGVLGVGESSDPEPIVFRKMSRKEWKKYKRKQKNKAAGKVSKRELAGKVSKRETAEKPLEDEFPIKFSFLVAEHNPLTISPPDAFPGALKINSGTVDVRLTVSVTISTFTPVSSIVLHNRTLDSRTLLNDDGIIETGDLEADDGIFSTIVSIDTDQLEDGECFSYVGLGATNLGGFVESDEYLLCATPFPIELAEPDTGEDGEDNLVPFGDATVIGNEVLVRFEAGTPSAEIQALAETASGFVAGTHLEDGLYQIRFNGTLTEKRLNAIISFFEAQESVVEVDPNYAGEFTSVPSDPEFLDGSQHGLQLVSANDLDSEDRRYVWDAGATGAGAQVVVLDSGVSPHPDNLNPKGEFNKDKNDLLGHGTQMAGIIGAATDNETAIAAMARDVTIRSVRVSKTKSVSLSQMLDAFKRAKGYAGRNKVISASFSINHMLSDGGVCRKINQIINRGAVVVVSAGNDNDNSKTGIVPGNCNSDDFNPFTSPGPVSTANKTSLIVVGATKCTEGSCDSDERWNPNNPDKGSNYGKSWVDISAPGLRIPATSIDGLTRNATGTSPATALVAGAAAILRSCDVGGALTSTDGDRSTLGLSLEDVFNAMDLGAITPVSGRLPNRLNLYHALASVNTLPTGIVLSNDQILENTDTTEGFDLAEIEFSDDTVCDAHDIRITGGADAANFWVGGELGNTLIIDDGRLDFETRSSYEVEITVEDFYGGSVNQTFTIGVIDQPEID